MTEENDPELQRIREEKMKSLQESASESNPSGNWPSEPVPVMDTDFDDFISKYSVVVVDCWAPWCGPCRMVAPIVDELAREYQGKIAFAKLDTDQNQQTAMRFRIMSIPTLLVFKDGELVDQIVGAMPKSELEPRLKRYL